MPRGPCPWGPQTWLVLQDEAVSAEYSPGAPRSGASEVTAEVNPRCVWAGPGLEQAPQSQDPRLQRKAVNSCGLREAALCFHLTLARLRGSQPPRLIATAPQPSAVPCTFAGQQLPRGSRVSDVHPKTKCHVQPQGLSRHLTTLPLV